ncbi:Crp/Fnr family transcriptional regulator [Streptomyces sp. NPDC023327]|uniref:Crp/Fnr family transcriptional regulator n=1 Tax=Streptomyces sp. NPDC023327 TaxID=3157088 RepID=UPI0033C915FB
MMAPNRRREDRRRDLLIGSSLYQVDETTGRVQYAATRSMEAVLEHNPFFQRLPNAHRAEFAAAFQRRIYERKAHLRGSGSAMVHIVLSGCVAEESSYGETTTVRILGTGAVLGDLEVFDETLATPTTRCLNTTMTLALPMDRMRAMVEHNSILSATLGAGITDRLVTAERVYGRVGLRPEERLAGLFTHLLGVCAVPCPRFGRMLVGPSQVDLADALNFSRATVECALRLLRKENLVVTGYRTFSFPSEAALAQFGKVCIPVQRVTGEASHP